MTRIALDLQGADSLGLKPYPKMKDSGVDQPREVPTHWEVWRLGRFGRFFKGSGGTKEDEREDGVPCVRYGDLYTYHQFFISKTRACVAPDLAETTYTLIQYGDVLFAGSGETLDEIGKSAVNLIRGPAYCGGDVIIFRPNLNVNARFLGYATDCLTATRQKACIGRGVTVMHIYSSGLKYMTLAIPPLSEQAAIVHFLNHIDRRIQCYIRAKEKLIVLLEEQMQAIIHQAVTGQFDVQSGQSYPVYQDSGVEWLGQVPEHWEVRRLRNVGDAIVGLTYDPQDVVDGEEGVLVLRASNILDGQVVDADNVFVRSSIPQRLQTLAGDILLCSRSGSRTLIGKNARICKKFAGVTFGAFMTVFRSPNNDYLHHVFNSKVFEHQSGAFFTSTINQLTLGILHDIRIPWPPAIEREAIATYVGKVVDNHVMTGRLVRNQIQLAHEYRTRMIADVVTGKFAVRKVAEGLPEVALVDEDDLIGEGDAVKEVGT